MNGIVVRLKANNTSSHVTQDQRIFNPSQLVLTDLDISEWKMLNLQERQVLQTKKYGKIPSVIQKNILMKKQVFYNKKSRLFHTDAVGKEPYITLMVFQLIKMLWLEACWNLILHFLYEQNFSIHKCSVCGNFLEHQYGKYMIRINCIYSRSSS